MFSIPSLQDSVTRARRAFRSYLPGTNAWLWPNNLNPTAKVFGGIEHLIFGFADYIQKQKFALTADGENLDMHGEELGLPRRPATPSSGPIAITATDALSIDPGAIFTRADGIRYTATVGAVIAQAGNLSVTVDAIDNGLAGNAIEGTPLDITSGVSGPGNSLGTATAEVDAGGIVGGLDDEDDETYRQRILFRKRNPPNGGSAADYVMWGMQVPGVTRVFVERLFNGAGTVRVFPLMDNMYSNGIPQPGDIARVAAFVDTVQPAGAIVTVAAPIASPVDVSIGLLRPFTTDVEEAVKLELAATFFANSRVAGIDGAISQMPYLAMPTSFSRSWIWQAVANAPGEARCSVNGPTIDPAIVQGHMATLGAVNFAAN
jgi:uncharacterized phage protein gp47/JayE